MNYLLTLNVSYAIIISISNILINISMEGESKMDNKEKESVFVIEEVELEEPGGSGGTCHCSN